MNKRLSILLLFALFTTLHAAILLDFYHRDYQMADRSVLVFDQKPNYKITKNDSHLLITIQNGQLDYDVKPQTFNENKLIKSINYSSQKDKLVIDFNLQDYDGKLPIWEPMEFEQNKQQYKVVIDFIKTKSPQTNPDAVALSEFYETIGQPKTAKDIMDQFLATLEVEPKPEPKPELKSELKPEQATVSTDTLIEIKSQPLAKATEKISFASTITDFFKVFPLLFYVLFALTIALVVLSIKIFSRNRSSLPQTSKPDQYSLLGFGSNDLQKKAALKLSEASWSDENIAKELCMSIEQLNKLLEIDISDEEITETEDL